MKFSSGEYIKKEDVMIYLKLFDWNMPREELIERIDNIPSLNLTERDMYRIGE